MSSRSRSSSEPRENRRIYVTGFSQKEDEHDMKKIFKKYGKVEDFSWKGKYFFVAYETTDEAKKAVRKMNKEEINGYTLSVAFARSRKRKDGACYNCGQSGHIARNCRQQKNESGRRQDFQRGGARNENRSHSRSRSRSNHKKEDAE